MSGRLGGVRAAFPALRRLDGGTPVAYFDGPGGTQVPDQVAEVMRDYLLHHNANTHWAYPTSLETDAALANAREVFADFLNVGADEVAFGANMTTLTFHVARALGRGWGAGDEIVVTELDHHANIAPWHTVARERGVTIRTARMDPRDGTLDLADVASLIGPRTRLVAIGAASNALGTVSDVPAVAELARGAGALVFVDAVHYAPHALADAPALGADLLACSAYKFYGPHVGVLHARRELGMALDVPKLAPAPDTMPDRLETGTLNHEGIVGAAAAVEFLASLGTGPNRRARLAEAYGWLHARGTALFERLWSGLAGSGRVTLYGRPPGAARTPTVAFTVTGLAPIDAARRLAGRGLYLSHGDFYAATVVERLGVGPAGLVRAGCACYTSEEEVDRLVEAVREL